MSNSTWRFEALDTWFFRESRPMESIGASELTSVFPPPARTVAGALRTAIGDHSGVQWDAYLQSDKYTALRAVLGLADSYGTMRISGPWLTRKHNGQWQRLYPVPQNIVGEYEHGKLTQLCRLSIGGPQYCDLGKRVRLPCTPNGVRVIKPLSGYYITGTDYQLILSGKTITTEALIEPDALFTRESRLGILRNARSRTAIDGMLYQTSHIRPDRQVAVEVDVFGMDTGYPTNGMVRFGGESRAASFSVTSTNAVSINNPIINGMTRGITLSLLTPLPVMQKSASFQPLPGFTQNSTTDGDVWNGEINGVPLTLHSAITDKAMREGGWDLVNQQPRDAHSLIPVGGVFYCTVQDNALQQAIDQLHFKQIDDLSAQDIALGRGCIAVGLWQAPEYPEYSGESAT